MIGRLSGTVVRRQPSEILLDVAGVGYRVSIPFSTYYALPGIGEAATLEIHTVVREDAILLFGFGSEAERSVFESLLSVSGVGPKVALAILSGLHPGEVVSAIESGDAPRLRTVPGVGRKLAERMVLELKETIGKILLGGVAPAQGPPATEGEEAESALLHLGYDPTQARDAVKHVRQGTAGPMPVETLLREALRILAR